MLPTITFILLFALLIAGTVVPLLPVKIVRRQKCGFHELTSTEETPLFRAVRNSEYLTELPLWMGLIAITVGLPMMLLLNLIDAIIFLIKRLANVTIGETLNWVSNTKRKVVAHIERKMRSGE